MELKGKPLTLSAKICGALLAFGGLGLKYSGLVPGLNIDDVLKVAFFTVAIFLPVDASLLVQNLLGKRT